MRRPASDAPTASTDSVTSAPPADASAASPASAQAVPAAPALKFDGARAWEHLRRQVAIGPRPAGSPAIAQTRRYITEQLAAVGLTTREQAFTGDTPRGPIPMINLMATIPGRRPERIVIATHYDTKLFREFRFVGASDGASSTAGVLELGRVLKARQNDYTIELLFFDGDDPDQLAWALRQSPGAKLILVRGAPLQLMKARQRRFYFDQGGKLSTHFAIRAVPARVRQQGRLLEVSEIVLPNAKGSRP